MRTRSRRKKSMRKQKKSARPRPRRLYTTAALSVAAAGAVAASALAYHVHHKSRVKRRPAAPKPVVNPVNNQLPPAPVRPANNQRPANNLPPAPGSRPANNSRATANRPSGLNRRSSEAGQQALELPGQPPIYHPGSPVEPLPEGERDWIPALVRSLGFTFSILRQIASFWKAGAVLATLTGLYIATKRTFGLIYWVGVAVYHWGGNFSGFVVSMTGSVCDLILGAQDVYLNNASRAQLDSLRQRVAKLRQAFWSLKSKEDQDTIQLVLEDAYNISKDILNNVFGELDTNSSVRVPDGVTNLNGVPDVIMSGSKATHVYLDSTASKQLVAMTCKSVLALKSRFSKKVYGEVQSRTFCERIFRESFGKDATLVNSIADFKAHMEPSVLRLERAFEKMKIEDLTTPAVSRFDGLQAKLLGKAPQQVAIERVRQQEIARAREENSALQKEYQDGLRFSPSALDLANGTHQKRLALQTAAGEASKLQLVHRAAEAGMLQLPGAGFMALGGR